MIEPTRIRDEGDALEVELLEAARDEAPSARAMKQTLAAMGLAAITTSPGLAQAKTGASGASATVNSSSAAGVTVKWVGLAGLAGLLAWGAMAEGDAPAPIASWGNRLAAVDAPPAAIASAPTAEEPPVVAGSLHDASAAPSSPKIAAPPAKAPPSSGAAEPPPVAAASLGDEIAALDRARRALDDDPSRAIAELAAYRARFPQGALRPEADALRVEALARAGRRDEAREAAETYVEQHPESPHAERVRAATK